MLGLVGFKPSAAAYCASKGAVVLLTKQIAVEYGAEKIHCNALCPGCEFPPLMPSVEHLVNVNLLSLTVNLDLKSPMTALLHEDVDTRKDITAMIPWGEWGMVEDVAKCAVFLASDDAAYVTGLPMVVDGGYTAQ